MNQQDVFAQSEALSLWVREAGSGKGEAGERLVAKGSWGKPAAIGRGQAALATPPPPGYKEGKAGKSFTRR